MKKSLSLFVGYDSREPIGFHTFCHSVITRASGPVTIVPLVQNQLRTAGVYTRQRGPTESTEFSLTRFLIPYLCDYKGHALFVDGADMLCRADLYELQTLVLARAWKDRKAVYVAQHDYTPATAIKMDGQVQTVYERKNWSSVMWMDCAQCTALTPAYVNSASGLELHRFRWLQDDQIGALPLEWNHIVGASNQRYPPKIVHFSDGGPFFKGYETVAYADEWFKECEAMLHPHINGGAKRV